MTKDDLITAIEHEWEALQSALDGLDERQLIAAPVAGAWTVKDLLAHLAVWESRLVTDLHKVERGVAPTWNLTSAQVDQLNAQFYREQKSRPLERVLEDLSGVHLALLNRLDNLPADALTDPKRFRITDGRPLAEIIAADSAEHFQEHTAEILAWRRRMDMGQ